MPEEIKTEQEPGSEPAEETPPVEEEPKEEPPAEEPPATEEPAEDEELDLERAKAKIAKANDEAKSLRTRLREAEEKLKAAKTPEEVEAVVKQITEERVAAERDLLIENVALKHGLPEAARKRLAGNTREELEADAKELAELFGTEGEEEISLEGGLSPKGGRGSDTADDPRSLAAKHGARKRR